MDKNIPTVSVIMPVYNAKKYVDKAIKSVLDQTYRDFELILVDDGATDGSGAICEDYAKKDKRIVLIHQKNGGICNARNTGLEVARGKYVAFCDHDDLYQPKYLELSVYAAEKSNADLVKFSYQSEHSQAGVITRCTQERVPDKTYAIEDIAKEDYRLLNKVIRVLWNGLYKRSKIDEHNIRFDESIRAGMEDFAFNLQLVQNISEIVFISDVLFIHYSRLEQSTFEKYNEGRLNDIISALHTEANWLTQNKVSSKITVQHRSAYVSLMARTLCHPDCPLSWPEKTAWLRKLKKADTLPSKGVLKEAIKEFGDNSKVAIQDILFALDWNFLLLCIWKLHMQRKNARKK